MIRRSHIYINLLVLLAAVATACSAGTIQATDTPSAMPTAWVITDVPAELKIMDISFTLISDDEVGINACTEGLGGVGITLRVMYNSSPNADETGEWRTVKELGVPCFNQFDRPVWIIRDLPKGKYLVRVEAKSPHNPNWENAVNQTVVYEIDRSKP